MTCVWYNLNENPFKTQKKEDSLAKHSLVNPYNINDKLSLTGKHLQLLLNYTKKKSRNRIWDQSCENL